MSSGRYPLLRRYKTCSAAFHGGTATYSQNVGIVSTNKVINRFVFALAAGFMLLAGLIPKFSGLLTTIPPSASWRRDGLRVLHHCHDRHETHHLKGLSPRTVTVVGLSWPSASASGRRTHRTVPRDLHHGLWQVPVVVATIVASSSTTSSQGNKGFLAD